MILPFYSRRAPFRRALFTASMLCVSAACCAASHARTFAGDSLHAAARNADAVTVSEPRMRVQRATVIRFEHHTAPETSPRTQPLVRAVRARPKTAAGKTAPTHTVPHAGQPTQPPRRAVHTVPVRTAPPVDAAPPPRPSSQAAAGSAAGYRVQVYTGVADRASRDAALRMKAKVQRTLPGLPVYVHFVAPRWICRVGDFRTRAEAMSCARLLRSKGVSSEAAPVACRIVRR